MIRKPKTQQKARRIGAAESFVESQMALGRVAFALSDLLKESGLSEIAAKRQLSRIRDKIVRISKRQPFFLIVAPEHRSFGAPPPTWWLQHYFDWLGRPYYLALQSAASLFGSNPQALQITQVMTTKPCRAINLGRVQVRFYVKSGIDRTPTLQPAGAVAPLRVSIPEATVCDLVRYASSIGGIERAAETISPLLNILKPQEIKRILEAESEIAVAQRLGFVFEALGAKNLAQTVRDWLPEKLRPIGLSQIPERHGEVPLVEHWQILNTSTELKV